ncbi:GerAB/ArcD/ProY family transporter [Metasolibacillus meyeri]|uniref:GerAB/ArcD/ProY family transporter n=1 Tax=Metasolibacillus meyeri TaxID=1071052 RepID=A0AAW9NLA4_9BACL|nr:GerAB/ArcD/ProY family transporter [Metasolibacillus meyeri]MEC1177231.1 GerAB/ArcD/ProY family transporter [Metasolibacillus meyeri]
MTKQLQIVMVFIIVYLSFGYLLYPDLIYTLTDTTHWLVVLCQSLLHVALVCLYIQGLKYFPNSTVTDIYLKMGKWAAIVVLLPFVVNLIGLMTFSLRMHTEAIRAIFLPRTPYWAILLLLMSIAFYVALKGFSAILRSAIFILFIILFISLMNTLSSFINYDVYNIAQDKDFSLAFLSDKRFLYLLGFSSFLFLGFISRNTTLTSKPFIIASIATTIISLSFVYAPLFIFGQETVVTMTNPLLEARDSVNLGWFVFNRQTMLFGIALIGLVIIANAVMLSMMGQILHNLLLKQRIKASYWMTIIMTISFIIAFWIPNQALAKKYFMWSTGAQATFMIIIPFTIFIYGFFTRKGVVKNAKS